jgi:hypothetical protein
VFACATGSGAHSSSSLYITIVMRKVPEERGKICTCTWARTVPPLDHPEQPILKDTREDADDEGFIRISRCCAHVVARWLPSFQNALTTRTVLHVSSCFRPPAVFESFATDLADMTRPRTMVVDWQKS